ncbi:MAG: pseudouridine synthase [Treponema sp.]|nr:pseudouridine synthase [Treponema sp.]
MRHKKTPSELYYFMMNKMAGEVCSTVSDSHKTVYSHFPPELLISNGAKLHSVGRLDADTEGLLLFTNDGKLSNFLTRPENKIEKKYFVRLCHSVSLENKKEYQKKAGEGLLLPAEKKFPAQKSLGSRIEWLSEDEAFITLTEGKFHEVKRIFRALENEVTYLKRVSFSGLFLDEKLLPGEWRKLSEEEVRALKFSDFVL